MSFLGQIFVDGLILLLQFVLVPLDHLSAALAKAYSIVSFGSTEGASSRQASNKKTVVIVGGNFSGLAALWELMKHRDRFRVILIDQKEYFEYTPGVLRLFCCSSHFENVAQKLPSGPFQKIQGKVTAIANARGDRILSYTTSENKTEHLSYDYIVLATGSTYNYPVTASNTEVSLKERQVGWQAAQSRLEAASSVLILGAGAVGCELAAEIVDFFPQKEVTMVDASPTLVPLFPKAVGEYAAKWLTKRGVRLALGQMLDSWGETSCKLRDGTTYRADIVYVCFGDKPNSQCVSTTSDTPQSSSLAVPFQPQLDRRKCIVVSNTLQLSCTDKLEGVVFACGDVATPPTEANKQAFHAETQGHLAAKNITRVEFQRKLLRYPEDIAGSSQMPLIFILSLGRYDGVLGFNELVVCGPITAVLKWGLEFTKVMHMQGRPLGKMIWNLAEEVVFFLSRTVVKPSVPTATLAKAKVG